MNFGRSGSTPYIHGNMRYPPSLLDEIRARLPTSAVVGKRVKLIKSGREWKGLSPFNAEKTPSFYVNDQKGFYHCFSSGKHGDIFSFLIETEGLGFPEAVERLAQDAGVPLPAVTAEMEVQERRRASLHEVMEIAARFFEDSLRGKAGVEARRYLAGRDLGPDIQAEFRLGYAPPDRFSLRDYLASKNVPAGDMIEAGLLITHEEVAVPYDRFRDRVMFPIADGRGRIIAFGGRALQKDAQAKYLNSPETPLFHKGNNLYNQQHARKAAHDKGFIIAVEGYVDVIAMVRAGFMNSVAPLGTALTDEQLALMWRMAPEPILCFDGDKAGLRAAFRAIDVALPHLGPGKSLRFAFLPAGQDPDDLLRSAGPQAITAVIDKPQPLVDVLWTREFERGPLTTPEQRADLERRLRDLVGQIRDETLKKHYRVEVEQRLRQLSGQGKSQSAQGQHQNFQRAPHRMAGMRDKPVRGYRTAPILQTSRILRETPLGKNVEMASPSYPPREVALVVAAINHPEILHANVEILASLEFSVGDIAELVACLVNFAAKGHSHTREAVLRYVGDSGLTAEFDRVSSKLNATEWWARAEAALDDAEMAWRQAADLHHKVRTLHKELKEVEAECGRDGSEGAHQRLNVVRNWLAAMEDGGLPVDNFGPKTD